MFNLNASLMKKFLLSVFFSIVLSLNLMSSNLYYVHNDNVIVLDINKIDLFEERMYLIKHLYDNPNFMITLGEEGGTFLISLSDGNDNDLVESFDDFYNDITNDFKQLSKDDAGYLFNDYKNYLPNEYVNHLMMDIYYQSRENNLCSEALPFCTDAGLYEFPAGVNAGNGETGPNYNCLSTTPNPAWYFLRIDNPGNINIYMYSTPSKDIDFCCWGPFDDPVEPCPNGLTSNKVVSCSYSTNTTETCAIPSSAQTGEYYLLIITNYSNNPCNISFEKTSGNGTTDCSILPPLIDSNSPLCVGETLELEAQNVAGATYSWTGPGGWTSSERNPTRSNVTMNMSGTYSCNITVGSQQSDAVSTDVEIFATSTASFTNTTVCEGTPTQFTCTSTSNPANNITTRRWDFGDGNTGNGTNPTHTYANSGTYTVTLTVNSGGDCSDSETKTVTVYSAPEANAGQDQTIDYGATATLNGTAGQGNFTYRWEPADKVVNPNAASTQTISLTSSVQFTLTATSAQGDCMDSDQVNINVEGAAMSAFATVDNSSICDTETAQLNITAAGGTGSFTYSWEPTAGLSNPNIANPVFTPGTIDVPSQSYTYVCTVSDGQTTMEPDVTIVVNKTYPNINFEDEVCQGYGNGSYQENNFLINTTESGIFEITKELNTINGCDSIVTMTLTVNPTYNEEYNEIIITDEVCYSESTYNENGFNINITDIIIPEGSDYTVFNTFNEDVSQYGCDSITNLSLTIYRSYLEEFSSIVYDTIETCDEPINWGGLTITETGDYQHLFTSSNSCDSLVKLHYVRNLESAETMIDTICNDGVSYDENKFYLYEWGFRFPGHYSGEKERLNEVGCKMVVTYDILLLNKLEASEIADEQSQLVYFTNTGFDFYDYSIDMVTGGGTDEDIDGIANIQETYHWDVLMISGDSKWTCKNDGTNNTTVNVTCDGSAYLTCEISTLCGSITKWILMYTPNNKPCEDARNLSVDLISNNWAEISWQSPSDSCEILYGTDENYSERIITTSKKIRLEELSPSTTYYWKVRSICDSQTDFVNGPTFTTKESGIGFEDNYIDNIAMYPNPANDNVIISGENIKMIEIYNIVGARVYKNDYVNDDIININTGTLNNGLYLVRIMLNNGKSGVKRLVIE